MNKCLILALVFLSVACSEQIPPLEVTVVQKTYQVDKLFEVDGCRVYRFEDGGHSRYFTNCSGATQWHEGCGKNCTRPVNVN